MLYAAHPFQPLFCTRDSTHFCPPPQKKNPCPSVSNDVSMFKICSEPVFTSLKFTPSTLCFYFVFCSGALKIILPVLLLDWLYATFSL